MLPVLELPVFAKHAMLPMLELPMLKLPMVAAIKTTMRMVCPVCQVMGPVSSCSCSCTPS